MSAPARPHCKCGHAKAAHEDPGLAPQCVGAGCSCLTYRPAGAPARRGPTEIRAHTPAPTPPRPAPAAAPDTAPSAEQLLAAGKRSEFKRTVTLAEKITALLADLRSRLADERDTAEARAEVAAAKAQLAAAKAKLAAASRDTRGEHRCPDCGWPAATLNGLGVHRARKHGHREAAS